ncbi:MAG: VOC family protein [Planctomycetota bacterium]|nr:MAG: VOC family protein [Planctomycetota bacterium]
MGKAVKAKAAAKTPAAKTPTAKAPAAKASAASAPAAKAPAASAPAVKRKVVKPIPEGQHSVTPYLVVRGATDAIDLYRKAFGAVNRGSMPGPDGKIVHAELQIGDAFIYLSDEMPGGNCRSPQSLGGCSCTIHLYLEDADAVFNQAVAAGCKISMPMMDAFWGDRYGKVTDPFGHEWSIGTHKEDLTMEEMAKRGAAAMAQFSKPG